MHVYTCLLYIYYAHLPIYNKFRWLAAAHFERFLGGVQVKRMLHGVGHVVPRGYLFRGRFLGTSGDLGGWWARGGPHFGVDTFIEFWVGELRTFIETHQAWMMKNQRFSNSKQNLASDEWFWGPLLVKSIYNCLLGDLEMEHAPSTPLSNSENHSID